MHFLDRWRDVEYPERTQHEKGEHADSMLKDITKYQEYISSMIPKCKNDILNV